MAKLLFGLNHLNLVMHRDLILCALRVLCGKNQQHFLICRQREKPHAYPDYKRRIAPD